MRAAQLLCKYLWRRDNALAESTHAYLDIGACVIATPRRRIAGADWRCGSGLVFVIMLIMWVVVAAPEYIRNAITEFSFKAVSQLCRKITSKFALI